MSEAVQVFVRCRPLNNKEKAIRSPSIVNCTSNQIELKGKSFTFDQVFGVDSSQSQVFSKISHVIDSAIEGYNGCLFCYGQTGTGKSYTMQGIVDIPDLRGITPNTFDYIFNKIKESNSQFLIRCSFLELYNEDILDLLQKSKPSLELKEHADKSVYVKDLTSMPVHSPSDMENIMKLGNKYRSVAATSMNDESSRSHSVFTITIEQLLNSQKVRVGKLNLVDLAGSERQSKTGATGERLKEGSKINQSLSTLGNVISSLVDNKPHIPYRDSKLTRLLQDALGGNSKTVMIATVSPADYNAEETISTLRYANRAKNIKNKPKINEDPKDTQIREYQNEINRIKTLLNSKGIQEDQTPNDTSTLASIEKEEQELLLKLEQLKSTIIQRPQKQPNSHKIEIDLIISENNQSLTQELQKVVEEKTEIEGKVTSLAEQVKQKRQLLFKIEKEQNKYTTRFEQLVQENEINYAKNVKIKADSIRDLEALQKIIAYLPKDYISACETRISKKMSISDYYRAYPIPKQSFFLNEQQDLQDIYDNTKERMKSYLMNGRIPELEPELKSSLFVYYPISPVRHLDYEQED